MRLLVLKVYAGVIYQVIDLHISGMQELQRIFIHAVGNVVDQPGDARIDQNLGAVDAGKMGDITDSRGWKRRAGRPG